MAPPQPERIAIIFSSKKIATNKIVEYIDKQLDNNYTTTLIDLSKIKNVNINIMAYDKIVLGSALYLDELNREMKIFSRKYKKELLKRPLALFAVGLDLPREAIMDSLYDGYTSTLVKHAFYNDCFSGELKIGELNRFERFFLKKIFKKRHLSSITSYQEVDYFITKLQK